MKQETMVRNGEMVLEIESGLIVGHLFHFLKVDVEDWQAVLKTKKTTRTFHVKQLV